MDDEALTGGMANAGAVVRRGALVVRPAPPHAPVLHDLLRNLRAHGFDGAPAPLGFTADGREQLEFVTGDVALPPFPGWALTDAALASVGALLRRLHTASARVPLDPTAPWPRELADPHGGAVLCHNDVCPENVVFRHGRAVALIDFDLAAPGRPVWDLAMTARFWVPMLDPETARADYGSGTDVPARLRLLADAYGLGPSERAGLPRLIEQATEAGRVFVARRVAGGDPVYLRALAERGGWERWDRLQAWLAQHREVFTAALLD